MLNDYMNRSAVMLTADRKLHSFICNAAYYLRQAEELMADYNDLKHLSYYKGMREEWPDMARLYRMLCNADIVAAKQFVYELEDFGLISYDDWRTISRTLIWFGIPAEDRYD